jgi:seryl-tRNA synthetase
VEDAELSIKSLGLTYRVMNVSTGKLPFAAARAYRLEVYSPGTGTWIGVSTITDCADFQSRRSNIRVRTPKGIQFVNTLNATACAASRIFGLLLEYGLRADGTITIPAVLHPYFGKHTISIGQ